MKNRGIIISEKGNVVVVMTQSFECHRLRRTPTMFLGQEVEYNDSEILTFRSNIVKYASIAAGFLLVISVTSFTGLINLFGKDTDFKPPYFKQTNQITNIDIPIVTENKVVENPNVLNSDSPEIQTITKPLEASIAPVLVLNVTSSKGKENTFYYHPQECLYNVDGNKVSKTNLLKVQQSSPEQNTYIRYVVNNIRDGKVNSAKIQLHCIKEGAPKLKVFSTSTNWTYSQFNIPIVSKQVASYENYIKKNETIDINLKDYIKGDDDYSILIKGDNAGDSSIFSANINGKPEIEETSGSVKPTETTSISPTIGRKYSFISSEEIYVQDTKVFNNDLLTVQQSSPRSYVLLKFNVKGITNKEILNSKIILNCVEAGAPKIKASLLETSSWNEGTSNVTEIPKIKAYLGQELNYIQDNTEISIDLLNEIKSDGIYSIMLSAENSADGASFSSIKKPKLEISFK